ncbi:MAG: nucleotidyltransferase domain-containing protein [bacterium]|nr:nucleotidyltransferase domain-containing protein [bacterium]
MEDIILQKLREIEEKEDVRILYAVESGSRAWGFESQDSDWDVRFVYAHPRDWYLSIEERRDVIELPISDSLDINGWDIRKALQLYKKTNPPFYEWLQSPIVYIERGDFAQKLRELMLQFYSPYSCLQHYLHMAKGNYKAYLGKEKVQLKKYFYVLRPVLACFWIEEKGTMPPTEFEKLLEFRELQIDLRKEIYGLLERKKSEAELGEEEPITAIDKFLEESMAHFEQTAPPKRISTADVEILDRVFREQIAFK